MKNVEAKSWHFYISKQKAPVNGVFVFNKPKQNVIFESYLNMIFQTNLWTEKFPKKISAN